MSLDLRIESYLQAIDNALKNMPLSQRAEIILDTKKNILAALEKDKNLSLDQVLTSLGQPEAIASRYGVRPAVVPRSPFIKWLVIGFLGTFAIFMTFVGIMVFKFSPFFEVSEKNGRIKMFGGTIDFEDAMDDWNGKNFNIHIGAEAGKPLEGSRLIGPNEVDKIFIPFRNGKFEVSYNTENKITWNCKINKDADAFSMASVQNRIFTLDLDKVSGVRCAVSLPHSVPATINGKNGDVFVDKALAEIAVQLESGRAVLSPHKNKNYQYDLKVQRGTTDDFESSADPKAIKIKVEIKNGTIQRS
jgi:hypothetical protein